MNVRSRQGKTSLWTGAALVAVLVGGAMSAHAGNLDPPVGPIGSTMKDLDTVEPRVPVQSLAGSPEALFVIDQPGSYYLTGDIIGDAGNPDDLFKHGIEIRASHVTLDLSGFSIIGLPASHADGIRISDAAWPDRFENITIRNGAIRGWAEGYGIIGFTNISRFDELRVTDNFAGGIEVFTDNALITRCVVAQSGESGLVGGAGAVVSECIVDDAHTGITVGDAAVVAQCSVRHCDQGVYVHSGVVVDSAIRNMEDHGIVAQSAVHVAGCVITDCAQQGIRLTRGANVVGNVLQNNSVGIYVRPTAGPEPNRIDGNNLLGNGVGIDVNALGNFIVGNSFNNNTVSHDIDLGNSLGQVINVTGDPSFASDNLWANIEY